MRKGWPLGLAIAAALALPGTAGGVTPARAAVSGLEGAMQAVERLLALDRDGKLQSPEARGMMSGELADMKLPTLGPLAKPDAVAAAENGAAVRSPATSAFPWDIYFFLKPAGGGWTIEAVRTLALPQFIHELRDELRAETHRNAEQDRLLRNFELTFKTDAELRLWFGAHRGDLDAMRGLTGLAAEAAAKRLDGDAFKRSPEGFEQFLIGGILDNSVGFLFVPEGKSPPPISPDNYIWIEPMGGGWHLYRTT